MYKAMQKMLRNLLKKFLCVFLACTFILTFCTSSTKTYAAAIMPQENQYLEFKVTDVIPIEGKDKQVIAELWAYNIEFTSVELNLKYDSTKLRPSNMETNEYIDAGNATDNNMFWKTEEFKEDLNIWFVQYFPDWLRYIFRIIFNQTTENQHIYTDENEEENDYTYVKAGEEGVLLGRFSYRLFNGKVDETTFDLQETPEQPTGIEVVIDHIDSYTDPNVFRVTLDFASSNADLEDIQIDGKAIVDFDKDELEYEIEILEERENIRLLPILDDDKATLKVERKIEDPENEGQYIYEEIEIDEDDQDYEIPLMGLGKETEVRITVTAEDGVTEKVYTLTITQPCGYIEGKVLTVAQKHVVNILVFHSEEGIDWTNINNFRTDGNLTIEDKAVKVIETEEDGSFSIGLPAGTYDILVDKGGYLDYIVKNIEVIVENSTEVKTITLLAGDINKDGRINPTDSTILSANWLKNSTNTEYAINMDFNEDGYINPTDLSFLSANWLKVYQVIEYWAM